MFNFNYNHVQAIFISLFIKLVENNLTKVNAVLGKHAYDGSVIFKCLGVVIRLSQPEGSNLFWLVIEALGDKHRFKLQKTPAINKRVVNELKVWFHKHGHSYRVKALEYIADKIDEINIHDHVRNVSVLDRFLGTQKEHQIKYPNNLLNEIMPTVVTVQRSIFNRVSIFTTVTTNGFSGCLSSILPVHLGVMRAYDTKVGGVINHHVRDAVAEHLSKNLQ